MRPTLVPCLLMACLIHTLAFLGPVPLNLTPPRPVVTSAAAARLAARMLSSTSSTLPTAEPASAAKVSRKESTGVNVFYSDKFLDHRVKGYHPENGFRVAVPAKALAGVEGIQMREPGVTPEEALAVVEKVHAPSYVQSIRELSARGGGFIDADTYANFATYDVCLLAAAAWMDAARHTLLGEDGKGHGRRMSFALTRPPGHHSVRDQAGGFCIFNFAICAATYALEELGCRRVAILDWDAHHGNGNEAFAREDGRIAYASLHQQDAFPLTGLDPDDHGPLNNVLDVPVPAYTDGAAYLPLLEEKVLPFLRAFEPNLLIVSAGYDCLADDPLAQLALGPADFTAIATKLKEAFGGDRIVMGLEGGYDPDLVAEAVMATVKPFLPTASPKSTSADMAMEGTKTSSDSNDDDAGLAICPTCGQQYGRRHPDACKICEDDRQWTPATGQTWTSLREMRAASSPPYRNEVTQLEPGVHSIATTPKFGIGQRCILVQGADEGGGNVLWDCVSFLDAATVAELTRLGGVDKIVLSHPHFLGSCLSWSDALPNRPRIYLHASDKEWVTRPACASSSSSQDDDRYVFWDGDALPLGPNLRAVRLGGHFPGSSVLVLRAAPQDGKGVAFTSDTILPVPHQRWISWMFSFPNLLPLPDFEVARLQAAVRELEAFDRLYGPFATSAILGDAKAAVLDSAQRYLDALAGRYHGRG